jgi:lysyl-tRNA synthetase class 2
MLEYYTMDADYMDSLALTEKLFAHLAREIQAPALNPPVKRITVAEAFAQFAGFDLFACAENKETLEREAKRLGLEPMPGTTIQQLYDLIFIHTVEPCLKTEKLTALVDYPAFVPCLAKKSSDGKTVERWELYYNGIELANCFSEETSAEKVKEFFISEGAEKERTALVKHKVDSEYWKLFEQKAGKGFPRCSGVAMGLDRLIMAITGRREISEVINEL